MTVRATGDTHIDDHHTVEDTGIALGQALVAALGDKMGIRRYGHFALAMDDTQVSTALDLSARPFLVWNVDFPSAKIGTFDTELVREFFFRPSRPTAASRCTWIASTESTATTSPKPHSNPSPAPCAWRSRPIRAPQAPCPLPKASCKRHARHADRPPTSTVPRHRESAPPPGALFACRDRNGDQVDLREIPGRSKAATGPEMHPTI